MAVVDVLDWVDALAGRGRLPRGAATDPDLDVTPLVQQIVDRGDVVRLRERRDGSGRIVPWRIRNLVPRSRVPGHRSQGAVFVCDGARVLVGSGSPAHWILHARGGALEGLTVSGGTWGPGSRGVLRHVKTPGAYGSVNRASFERMRVVGCARGFHLGSANGCHWRACSFDAIGEAAIHLGADGDDPLLSGNVHACRIEHCAFRDVGGSRSGLAAISLDAPRSARPRSKLAIAISGCVFDALEVPAVAVRGAIRCLSIDGCWMGPRTVAPHVRLESGASHARAVHVRDGVWAGHGRPVVVIDGGTTPPTAAPAANDGANPWP
ncbi:MAG: hypothetical protein NZ898_16930 [Myxococcota bacterium]|nr:hypothetical protein [Myxococcota bacterium]